MTKIHETGKRLIGQAMSRYITDKMEVEREVRFRIPVQQIDDQTLDQWIESNQTKGNSNDGRQA